MNDIDLETAASNYRAAVEANNRASRDLLAAEAEKTEAERRFNEAQRIFVEAKTALLQAACPIGFELPFSGSQPAPTPQA